jgi:hypothetical protein
MVFDTTSAEIQRCPTQARCSIIIARARDKCESQAPLPTRVSFPLHTELIDDSFCFNEQFPSAPQLRCLKQELFMPYESAQFWTGALALVLQIITLFPRDKGSRTNAQEEALRALSEAYHSTEGYYAYLKENPRKEEQEWEIAKKWFHVSVLLRKYDPAISQRLDLKSRYWREGATWSNEAIKEAGIGLSRVWAEVNVRLNEESS